MKHSDSFTKKKYFYFSQIRLNDNNLDSKDKL